MKQRSRVEKLEELQGDLGLGQGPVIVEKMGQNEKELKLLDHFV